MYGPSAHWYVRFRTYGDFREPAVVIYQASGSTLPRDPKQRYSGYRRGLTSERSLTAFTISSISVLTF